ncbi:MAG: pimeloyl-ACP methyl ester carboxylesterase [Halieaceae bacterium]|jgi:pimeloyl-ACP methyl ester carboxylesterase
MMPAALLWRATQAAVKPMNLLLKLCLFCAAGPLASGVLAQQPPAATVCAEPSAGTISFADIRAKYADPDSRFVTLEGLDGIDTHYKVEGQGPAVLLVHSSSGDLKDYDTWVDTLKADYRVVRLDLPAFGLSGAVPSGNYSIDRYLMLVDALMDHLGIERFAIAGTSYGGLVAFRYAGTRTDRVTALIVQNSAGVEYGGRRGTEERARDSEAIFVPRTATQSGFQKMLNTVINDPSKVTPELVRRKTDFANVIGRDCESFVALRLYERGNPQRVLSHVRAPALVLWGGNSKGLSVATANIFAEAMVNAPSVDKVIYAGGGHLTHIERPAETATDVKAFLDRVLAP